MKSIAKKVLAVLVFAITTAVSVFGQNGFSYQAVIRNDKGELVVDKQVVVKLLKLFFVYINFASYFTPHTVIVV